MIRQIAVLGGGSAGFLAAMTLKTKLPHLSVTVIRSLEVGVIGVGESTTIAVPRHLHGYLDLDPTDFYRLAQPSWKLGIRFLWGPRPFFDYTFASQLDVKWNVLPKNNGFYCDDDFQHVNVSSCMMSDKKVFLRQPNGGPLLSPNYGYHIDNPRFVAYLERMAAGMGICVQEDVVSRVEQGESGVVALHLASGATCKADLFVDCSGFRSLLLGETLQEPYTSFKSTLFCDRAVVGSWPRTSEVINPYTTAETMEAGWCWQIDHPDSINRGYVYAADFISDEAAEREFRAKNPLVKETRLVKFVSGRHRRAWVKNVVAIGNSAGFVEPLESTALAVICDASRLLAEGLFDSDCEPTLTLTDHYNRVVARVWDSIRDFLGIHYKFNARIDNPFWRACRAKVELAAVQDLIDFYQDNGPSTFARNTLLEIDNIFTMEGYLVMLVGQKVPYRRKHASSAGEMQIWNRIRQENRAQSAQALSVQESLAFIASPHWRWGRAPRNDASAQPAQTQLTSYVARREA